MSKDYPKSNTAHCEICGNKTITKCVECNTDIRGYYHAPGVIGGNYSAPQYCHNCGKAFPWTQSRIELVKELINELGLEQRQKDDLVKDIENIVCDTQRTELACYKFKRITSNLKPEMQKIIKDVLINIVTDKVKELMWNINPS